MNIIIVFPQIENAKKVRSILLKGGYSPDAVCCTGAAALKAANDLDSGIIICTYRLADMVYSELYEYLAPRYDMLLIGSKSQIADRDPADITALSTPLKVHELLQAVEQVSDMHARKMKKRKQVLRPRTDEERRVIGQAKALLMERHHYSEEEAHRHLQKLSMDNGARMAESARLIIRLMGQDEEK